MAKTAKFSREEQIGLLVAGVAHAALVAALLTQAGKSEPYTPPERIVVSLATEVSLESTAPDPADNPSAALAPILAEVPEQGAPSVPVPPVAQVPRPTPAPRPTARATSRPTPTPTATRAPTPTPTPSAAPAQQARTERATGSVESAFSDLGTSAGERSNDGRLPASQIGRSERASLVQSISRQLRPNWDAPNGLQAEMLVTTVTWRLNSDGSLDGRPQCNPTTGVTDSNRTQSTRHCELAIRAIRLTEPFDLNERYYEVWKLVRDFRFDGSL